MQIPGLVCLTVLLIAGDAVFALCAADLHRGTVASRELQYTPRPRHSTARHSVRCPTLFLRDLLTCGHVLPLVSVLPTSGRGYGAVRIRLRATKGSGGGEGKMGLNRQEFAVQPLSYVLNETQWLQTLLY